MITARRGGRRQSRTPPSRDSTSLPGEGAKAGRYVRADIVVQPRSTALRAKRVDWTETRHLRVVHVVVKLVEGLLQFRVLADLRTDRDQFACWGLHEMPMRRNWSRKQVRGIGEAGAGEREQPDRSDQATLRLCRVRYKQAAAAQTS